MTYTSIKKRLSLTQIINMSVGFFGIQFGFALQNGNASRILSTFGADVHELTYFWLAAPLTGMIVQPIIGYFSDHTWTSLGRRRPYFLAGSILASVSLLIMPNAHLFASLLPPLYIGAGILMIMDASFNVSMEPFRALVGDLLPGDQRTLGFAVQTSLIGLGAVIGSTLPYLLAEYVGISKVSEAAEHVPDNVVYSFYVGAFIFLITIVWTVVTTKEFPPDEIPKTPKTPKAPKEKFRMMDIVHDFLRMPKTMRQLGVVQFFSWFALFSMWVYTTSAVATHHYHLSVDDHSSVDFNRAGNWVGVIFGVYNGVSAIFALFLPFIAKQVGRKLTHALSLCCGGAGLLSLYFVSDPTMLVYSMIGVGIAWASILSMPYAILGGAIPPHKMGIYMGVFNFFITLPQILNGILGGKILTFFFNNQPIYSILMAGVSFFIAALFVLRVEDKELTETT